MSNKYFKRKNILGKFSELFIERYRVTYLLVIVIIILGSFFYTQLPRESFPDSVYNACLINITYVGASSEDVEEIVTKPIEEALYTVDGVQAIDSISQEGISQVIIKYDFNKDPENMMSIFRTEVSKLEFNEDVSAPKLIEFRTSELPFFRVGITGAYDLTTLKTIGKEYKDRIKALKGVTKVSLVGGYDREISITFDYDKLEKYNLNIQTIKRLIAQTNINMPVGKKRFNRKNYTLRINETFNSLEEIRDLAIYAVGNEVITIGDIAEVTDVYRKANSYSTIYINKPKKVKTSNPAVYLAIYRDGGTDTVSLCNQIKELIHSGKGQLYSEDVIFYITQDDSIKVQKDLTMVTENAVSGLLVVIVVLFLFIGLRESLIVSVVIPLSMFISFILMKFWGLTFNQMTLTGFIVALGMLVDNAIVVMENVDRLRDQGFCRLEASKVAIHQIAPAILAATITTVVAFLPLLNISGAAGEFIKSIPLTIIFALMASLGISFVITPALSSRFLSKYKLSERKFSNDVTKTIKKYGSPIVVFLLSLYAFRINNSFGKIAWTIAVVFSAVMLIKQIYIENHAKKIEVHKIIHRYSKYIYKIVCVRKKRVVVVLFSGAIFVASMMTIFTGVLPLETFPQEEPSQFTINIETPKGYLLEDTKAIVAKVEKIIFEYDSIKAYNSSIGLEKDYKAMITVQLKEKLTRKPSEIINHLLKQVNHLAEARIRISEKKQKGAPLVEAPIEIFLKGANEKQLNMYAQKYLKILRKVEGVRNPYSDVTPGLEQIKINIRKNKAFNLGLTVRQIAQQIKNNVQGISLGVYKDQREEVDIIGYTSEERIESINDLEKIYFKNNQHQMIPFSDVCYLTFESGVSTIERKDLKRVVSIKSQTFHGSNSKEIMDRFHMLTKEIQLPETVEVSTGGDLELLNDLIDDMIRSLGVALILVFIVLSLQFNSISQPLVILLSVPLSFIGVVFGLILTKNSLGIYAMMGAVSLVGIAVNDAIVLVDFANQLRENGKDKYEAISKAVEVRCIPVLATSLTTMGGVLPLALKNPTFEQMAYVIFFGLFASTILTLFIIPNIYIVNDNVAIIIKSKFNIFEK